MGLAIIVPVAKKGWLLPQGEPTWDFANRDQWDSNWSSQLEQTEENELDHSLSLGKAWLPYLLIALLLVASRLPQLGIAPLLKSASIESESVFGSTVGVSIQPLYLPGTIFLLVCLITVFLHRMPRAAIGRAMGRSFKMVASASTALVFAVPMVQVFINSSGGAAGLTFDAGRIGRRGRGACWGSLARIGAVDRWHRGPLSLEVTRLAI